jgi:hypothetical protein
MIFLDNFNLIIDCPVTIMSGLTGGSRKLVPNARFTSQRNRLKFLQSQPINSVPAILAGVFNGQ